MKVMAYGNDGKEQGHQKEYEVDEDNAEVIRRHNHFFSENSGMSAIKSMHNSFDSHIVDKIHNSGRSNGEYT